jgi:hypothetical protein
MAGQQTAAIGSAQLGAVLPGVASAVPLTIVGYPFDTVKTRLQLQRNLGMVQCVKDIAANEGLLSLYRGSSISLCILSCKMGLELSVFEWCSARFRETSAAPFAGGLFGSFFSTTAMCPLTVVKIQMQMAGRGTHASPAAAASAVWRARGIRGFFHGLTANLGVQVPFSTLFFGSYGLLREALPQAPWSPLVAGGAASLATWTVLQPLDTLRTIAMGNAHQTTVSGADASASSAPSAFVRSLVRHCGVRSLWRGFGPVTLRAIPSSGGSMLMYEWAKMSFNKGV